jgi:hypothetical protein
MNVLEDAETALNIRGCRAWFGIVGAAVLCRADTHVPVPTDPSRLARPWYVDVDVGVDVDFWTCE